MTAGEITGTIGVTILLLAFALQLGKRLRGDAPLYLLMNAAGAALAGLSSYLIRFWPFVVLEAVWTLASLAALLNVMRKKAGAKNILPLLLCLLLFSCRTFREPELVGVEGFSVNEINPQKIDGDLRVRLKNPNSYGFTIYPSTFDVSYSGVALGEAKLAKKVKIGANKEAVYTFGLHGDLSKTNLSDVMKLLSGSMFRNELLIHGRLKAGKFLFRKSFPVELREKITLQ